MRLPGCLALALLSLQAPQAAHAGAPAPACIQRRLVDPAVPNVFPGVPNGPLVGIDATGSVLAAWGYEFSIPGELYTARYDAVTGWGPKTPLDTGPAEDRVHLPSLAVNADGDALLAWSGQAGIYAAAFVPGDGWQETQTIDSGTSPFLTFAERLTVAIDADGNGLLVWANDNGDMLRSSRYTASSSAWTEPAEIGDRDFARSGSSLAMTASGDAAILLWEHWAFTTWTLNASSWAPATGWAEPVVLDTSDASGTPAVAMNDAGGALAAWVVTVADPSLEFSLHVARRPPGMGWEPEQPLSDEAHPAEPLVDVSDSGNGIVLWATRFDKTISADRFLAGDGWQGIEVLKEPGLGDPMPSAARIDDDGNAFAAWQTAAVPTGVAGSRYRAATGWQSFNFMGGPQQHDFRLRSLATNAAGLVAAGFAEARFDDATNVRVVRFSLDCEIPLVSVAVTGSGAAFSAVVSNPPGIACGTECSARYVAGTQLGLFPTTVDPFVSFTGWSGGGCSGSGFCQLAVSADAATTATFQELYTLSVGATGSGTGTITSDPPGIDCGPDCAESFEVSTTVTLTATPAPGSAFTGWAPGDCSGTEPCSLFISRDFAVSGAFDIAGPLQIGALALPDGEVGVPYQASLDVSGGTPPYGVALAKGALPPGLAFGSPEIVGTPQAAWSKGFAVVVTETAGGALVQKFRIRILAAPSIATQKLKNARSGRAYVAKLKVKGGKEPFVWSLSAGSLPPGLMLDGAGSIAGSTTQVGEFPLTLEVGDALGGTAQRALTLTVAP